MGEKRREETRSAYWCNWSMLGMCRDCRTSSRAERDGGMVLVMFERIIPDQLESLVKEGVRFDS